MVPSDLQANFDLVADDQDKVWYLFSDLSEINNMIWINEDPNGLKDSHNNNKK